MNDNAKIRENGIKLRKALFEKIRESLLSVTPVAAIVLIVCLTPLVELRGTEIMIFIGSAFFLILGIGLFNLGADLAMSPMGEYIGTGLTKTRKFRILLPVVFFMGVLITINEPDLSVLGEQVGAVMNSTLLIVTVGVGVGIFLLLAVLKIIVRADLSMILMFFYMTMFALTALLIEKGNGELLSLCYDSGGVTTGPVTVPFIMALGIGISATIGGRNAKENSFGLVALCSVGPILAVLGLSLMSEGSPVYELTSDILTLDGLFGTIGASVFDLIKALSLIVIFFMLLQYTVLKLPRHALMRIGVGIGYTFVGLVIFLSAVGVGFMPMGLKIGKQLAENAGKPVLIGFGLILGAVTVLAEPAVHVLNKQVEEVTGGGVTKKELMTALSLGVGTAIGLSVIRIIYGFSLLWYLIPGYLLSLGLSFFVPKLYTAIAFDSGGVASGPLTSSFILPMMIGICAVTQGNENIMQYAFGAVAMVALTPLITIQSLGFKAVFSSNMRRRIALRRIVAADDEQIIEFAQKGDGKNG